MTDTTTLPEGAEQEARRLARQITGLGYGRPGTVVRALEDSIKDNILDAMRWAMRQQAGEVDALREQIDHLTYALHHGDFSTTGIPRLDGGDRHCIGTDWKKLQAAKRLRKLGLVKIEDSPAGPMVTRIRQAEGGER